MAEGTEPLDYQNTIHFQRALLARQRELRERSKELQVEWMNQKRSRRISELAFRDQMVKIDRILGDLVKFAQNENMALKERNEELRAALGAEEMRVIAAALDEFEADTLRILSIDLGSKVELLDAYEVEIERLANMIESKTRKT